MQHRCATIERSTAETRIRLALTVDGSGTSRTSTGIGFFDHMLDLFARHGRYDLEVEAEGDLEVDCHHTVEDVGIVLGEAFREALGDKKGIFRYGSGRFPMDEALVSMAVDFGGRAFLFFDAPPSTPAIREGFNFSLIEEFLRAFAFNARINLHAEVVRGRDPHHMAEAVFKGLARCTDEATSIDARTADEVPSTKGTL